MRITLSSGVGSGPTKLAAFDAALGTAGVANYNLIRLSSVIPPGSSLSERTTSDNPPCPPGQWGDRLYVVLADQRVDTPNVEAWAGIGWVQEPGTGRGLFVEHEGLSEHAVRLDIEQSLQALQANRSLDFGRTKMHVVGTVCEEKPVCALVVATYQAAPWIDSSGDDAVPVDSRHD